jgi:hypothetical protein
MMLAVAGGLPACGPLSVSRSAAQGPVSPSPQPSAVLMPPPGLAGAPGSPAACAVAAGQFSCTMRQRITEAEDYLKTRPGLTGIVLRDRTTGAVWRNEFATAQVYMASTSKLAIVVTLLSQDHAGRIHLSAGDRSLIHQMLHVSSDTAADELWFKYGASFYTGFFPQIGLTSARYLAQAGVQGPYWGEMTCTPEDLDRVVSYVLGDLPASLRDYIVYELRHVGTVQQFGVWGAGPQSEPGNKDGWSVEKPGWIIDSAGFAGPGATYTLTMMNSLEGQGNYQDGTDTVTQVAAILFQGHQIPAPTLQATP